MSATEIQKSLESIAQGLEDSSVKLWRVPAVAQSIRDSVKVIMSTALSIQIATRRQHVINSIRFVSEARDQNELVYHVCVNLTMTKAHMLDTRKGCTTAMVSRVVTDIFQSMFECRCACTHGTFERNLYWSNGGRQRPKGCLGCLSQT